MANVREILLATLLLSVLLGRSLKSKTIKASMQSLNAKDCNKSLLVYISYLIRRGKCILVIPDENVANDTLSPNMETQLKCELLNLGTHTSGVTAPQRHHTARPRACVKLQESVMCHSESRVYCKLTIKNNLANVFSFCIINILKEQCGEHGLTAQI